MRRREIRQLLQDNGFVQEEGGSRHEVWSCGIFRVPLSRGSAPVPYRLVQLTRATIKRCLRARAEEEKEAG